MADEERKQSGEGGEASPQAAEDKPATENGAASEVDTQHEALRQELAAARAKAEENWNQFLRARAELENVRRRAERDVEQAHRYGLEKLAAELLAVRDSLEMGVSAAQEANADAAKLREGTELTLKMLDQALDKFEICELNPLGEKFDPAKHEAMAAQESAEHDPNTVIHVVQKGYRVGERLLRPAMVIVAKSVDKPQGGQIDEQA